MEQNSIFDLSKTVNNFTVDKKQKLNMDELLKGYKLVEPEDWDKIQYKKHIRYLRNNGEFKKGGYVVGIISTADIEGNPTIKIDMVSGFNYNAIKWSIYKSSISKIWEKIENNIQPGSSQQVQGEVDLSPIKDDITFCKQSIEMISKKIQQMENENKRVIALIKKLHNI